MLILGIGILGSVVLLLRHDQSLKRHGATAAGVIVEFDFYSGNAVVQFVTASGEEIRADMLLAWTNCCPGKGDRVKVYYNPQEPTDVSVDAYQKVWLQYPFVILFGVLATGFGLLLVSRGRR